MLQCLMFINLGIRDALLDIFLLKENMIFFIRQCYVNKCQSPACQQLSCAVTAAESNCINTQINEALEQTLV